CLYVFFFQAEDGIRDFHVTGVQTCALPISRTARAPRSASTPEVAAKRVWQISSVKRSGGSSRYCPRPATSSRVRRPHRCRGTSRSEERSVGKEGRCRRARDVEKRTDVW